MPAPFTYVQYTDAKDIATMAKRALKKHLYVRGWTLKQWLEYPEGIREIGVCYDGPNMVGISVRMLPNYEPNVGVFIIPTHRRQGIGTQLVNMVSSKEPVTTASEISGSRTFYKKIQTRYLPNMNILH